MEQATLSGKCLCGAVTVTARIDKPHVSICHCDMCRTWSGGPMLAVEAGDAVQFEGEECVSVYRSSDWAERGFCNRCGTHLFYRLKDGGLHALPAGLLDFDGWEIKSQIFIDEKPDWYAFDAESENLTGAQVFAAFGSEA